jgi:hypothetical protein
MVNHHYVWADVWLDHPSDWMLYDIYYKSMATPHYACTDVWLEDSYKWMPYYIFHRESAFHYVSAVDQSVYPDKKVCINRQ